MEMRIETWRVYRDLYALGLRGFLASEEIEVNMATAVWGQGSGYNAKGAQKTMATAILLELLKGYCATVDKCGVV